MRTIKALQAHTRKPFTMPKAQRVVAAEMRFAVLFLLFLLMSMGARPVGAEGDAIICMVCDDWPTGDDTMYHKDYYYGDGGDKKSLVYHGEPSPFGCGSHQNYSEPQP